MFLGFFSVELAQENFNSYTLTSSVAVTPGQRSHGV